MIQLPDIFPFSLLDRQGTRQLASALGAQLASNLSQLGTILSAIYGLEKKKKETRGSGRTSTGGRSSPWQPVTESNVARRKRVLSSLTMPAGTNRMFEIIRYEDPEGRIVEERALIDTKTGQRVLVSRATS